MRTLTSVGLALIFGGCPPEPSVRRTAVEPGERKCQTISARQTSPVAKQVFREKHCQGGGVTWAGLIAGVVATYGPSEPLAQEGWTGDARRVQLREGPALMSIDEEGERARFCTDAPRLAVEVARAVETLNRDEVALRAALAAADPLSVECFEPKSTTRDRGEHLSRSIPCSTTKPASTSVTASAIHIARCPSPEGRARGSTDAGSSAPPRRAVISRR